MIVNGKHYLDIAEGQRAAREEAKCACSKWAEETYGLVGPCPWHRAIVFIPPSPMTDARARTTRTHDL